MASMPFKYWTGKMRYRFQVVASAMHRGRLAIVYDPVSTPTVREDNVNYIEIIDISQCREFTVEVSNNQPFTLLEHARPSSQDVSSLYDTDPLTFAAPYGNGTISVWVINELTTPTTDPTVNNDIKINVFLAAGDDFEVFVPDATEYSKFVVTPSLVLKRLKLIVTPHSLTRVWTPQWAPIAKIKCVGTKYIPVKSSRLSDRCLNGMSSITDAV
jgi:hypothetical protein